MNSFQGGRLHQYELTGTAVHTEVQRLVMKYDDIISAEEPGCISGIYPHGLPLRLVFSLDPSGTSVSRSRINCWPSAVAWCSSENAFTLSGLC
jgi:hypothetical protein